MTHFVSSRFTLPCLSPKAPKRFEKERFGVMRLQAGCFGTFHFFSHMRNTAGVHCVIGERSLLNQVLDMVAIDGVSDGFSQARADEQRTLENKL